MDAENQPEKEKILITEDEISHARKMPSTAEEATTQIPHLTVEPPQQEEPPPPLIWWKMLLLFLIVPLLPLIAIVTILVNRSVRSHSTKARLVWANRMNKFLVASAFISTACMGFYVWKSYPHHDVIWQSSPTEQKSIDPNVDPDSNPIDPKSKTTDPSEEPAEGSSDGQLI
jgi:hypothetical protein